MILKNLNNKQIAFLGLGIENFSLINFLISKKIQADFFILDQRNKNQLGDRYTKLFKNKKITWRLGKNYDCDLIKYDIIMRSPGYPLFSDRIIQAKKNGVIISSPIKLFFGITPTKNIIGVTGTKGKGTTASLITAILLQAKKKAYLGGNIGIPVFDFFEKLNEKSWVVLELSSFQLEDLKAALRIAIITNFFKEHLLPADTYNPNYHRSLLSYWRAKTNIFRSSCPPSAIVINENLKTKFKKIKLKGKLVYFSKSKLKSKLTGEHNKENITAAEQVAKLLKISGKNIAEAVSKFKGLEHRLEFVKKVNGVCFYNDSFATTEESAITALSSFSRPIILLAGGADKGADFKKFSRQIKKSVKLLVLLQGRATLKLKNRLLKTGFPKNKIKSASNICFAVKTALSESRTGDIVLLSPGCASFGMFKNYKERGELFKKEVKNIK